MGYRGIARDSGVMLDSFAEYATSGAIPWYRMGFLRDAYYCSFARCADDMLAQEAIPRYRMGYRCDIDCSNFAHCAGDALTQEAIPRYRMGYRCDIVCSILPIVRATCLPRKAYRGIARDTGLMLTDLPHFSGDRLASEAIRQYLAGHRCVASNRAQYVCFASL